MTTNDVLDVVYSMGITLSFLRLGDIVRAAVRDWQDR